MSQDIVSRGVRIGNESLTFIKAKQKIRPLRDGLVVEPLEWEPSDTLSVVYTGKPLRGVVRAAGPGCYPKRYNGPKGKRTKSWNARSFRPCDVRVGDIVELGGLELGGYLYPTVVWGNAEVILCREEDVCVVVE